MQVHTNSPHRVNTIRAHINRRRTQPRRGGLIPSFALLFPSSPLSFPFSPVSIFFRSYVSDTAPPCSFPASRFIDQTLYLAARTCTVHFRIILFLSNPTDSFAASRNRFFLSDVLILFSMARST